MTNLATFEAPLTTTVKASDDRDAPWLVIRSRDAAHLESQCMELENGGALVAIGRLARALNVKTALGFQLSAKPVDPQPQSATFTPPAGVSVQPQQAMFTSDGQAGTDPNWGNPNAAPQERRPLTQADGFLQSQLLPEQAAPVGAPMTPFGPAILLSSAPGAAKPWKAWGDPRPQEQLAKFTKEHFTDNPNDPGLTGGTKRFMQRIN